MGTFLGGADQLGIGAGVELLQGGCVGLAAAAADGLAAAFARVGALAFCDEELGGLLHRRDLGAGHGAATRAARRGGGA